MPMHRLRAFACAMCITCSCARWHAPIWWRACVCMRFVQEVTYIIDYYASENKESQEQEYFIDCRPTPTPGGLVDRARVAFKRWRKGEAVW